MDIEFHRPTRQFRVKIVGEPPEYEAVKKLGRWDPLRKVFWVAEIFWADMMALSQPGDLDIFSPYLIQEESNSNSCSIHTAPHALDYQRKGVEFLTGPERGMGLFDSLGLGKSAQALWAFDTLARRGDLQVMVVVCPKRVIPEWHDQFQKHLMREPEPGEFLVMNYEQTYRKGADAIQKATEGRRWVLVIDEVHRGAGDDTRIYEALTGLSERATRVWTLTGTPVRNRPESSLGVYRLTTGAQIKRPDFLRKFCLQNSWGQVVGYRHLEQLEAIFKTFAIRRRKEDVLELPPKQVIPVPVVLEGRQSLLYAQMRDEFLVELREHGGGVDILRAPWVFSQMIRLLQIACHPGLLGEDIPNDRVAKMVALGEILDEAGEQKVIVWSKHPWVLEQVVAFFPHLNGVYAHGRCSEKQNDEARRKFREDPSCMLAALSIGAFNAGVNLQQESGVAVFFDLPWEYAPWVQAQDRIHRIGQTRDRVTLYVLVAEETLDGVVLRTLEKKRLLEEQVIGGATVAAPSAGGDVRDGLTRDDLLCALRARR